MGISLRSRLRPWLIASAIGVVLAGATIATSMAQEARPCAGNKSCNAATGAVGVALPTKDAGTVETDSSGATDDAASDAGSKDDSSGGGTTEDASTATTAPSKSTSSTTEATDDGAASSVAKDDEAAAGEACSDVPGIDGTIRCYCEMNGLEGGIWGTHLYTIDSTICLAAVHAGALQPILQAGGGTVYAGTVELRGAPGCPSYPASTANGVTSWSYSGMWQASFYFPAVQNGVCDPANPPAPGTWYCPPVLTEGVDDLACHCTPDTFETGTIWGTDIYTSDSQICRSALHAGVVGPEGGGVHVVRLGGQASYEASSRNGVDSFSYDSWETSIGFE
ncbi:MAG: LCCL domain-containing protein [Dongiaceae bacterium]